MSKKKICIVDPSSYTLPYDSSLIQELSKYYYVDFYCSKGKTYSTYYKKLEKYCFLKSYNVSPSIPGNNLFFGLINYLLMLIDIYKNRKLYDVINFQWSIFFLFDSLFFSFLRKKIVFTIHNHVPHSSNRNFDFKVYVLSMLSLKNIFVSSYTFDAFENIYFSSNKNFLLQHGIMPLSDIDCNYSEYCGDYSLHNLTFWGRVEEYKGVDVLLSKELHQLNIGIYGSWSKNLSDLKNKFKKSKNIVLIDEYISNEEVLKILSQKSIFVLPYKSATQSGVLYTLLAHKVIFISSNAGENANFLKTHNLESLIFDRNSIADFIRAYEYAVSNYDFLKSCFTKISIEYDWSCLINDRIIKDIYA